MDNIIAICNRLASDAWQTVDKEQIDSYYINASKLIYENILYQLAIFYCIDYGLEDLADETAADCMEFAFTPEYSINQIVDTYKIYKAFLKHTRESDDYIMCSLDSIVDPQCKFTLDFNYTHITRSILCDKIGSLFFYLEQIKTSFPSKAHPKGQALLEGQIE